MFSKSFVKTIIKINVTQALGLHSAQRPVTPVQHEHLSGELKQNGLWLEPCKQTEIVLENVENRKGRIDLDLLYL